MPKLAVIILTKNEENNIVDCIRSVDFADEIIVIDSGSVDKTKQLAEDLLHIHRNNIRLLERYSLPDLSSTRDCFGERSHK